MKDLESFQMAEYIGRLLYLKHNGQISEADQSFLNQWLYSQDAETREFFESISEPKYLQSALYLMYNIDLSSAFSDIQKKIADGNNILHNEIEDSPKTKVRGLRYIWASAAAALILFSIGIVYRYINRNGKQILPIAIRYKNDIPPGKYQAMLQLPNGEDVELSSLKEERIFKEYGVSIKKTREGELSYRVVGEMRKELAYSAITTPRGGRYKVILPDGSKVWLNSNSTLTFPLNFSMLGRSVEISGEAYFEVSKNKSIPFLVKLNSDLVAKPIKIKVLGTAFNVKSYSDERENARITLIKGAISVSDGSAEILVHPGEQIQALSGVSTTLNLTSIADTTQICAWKNGVIKFENASISEIMAEAARWYDIDVVYDEKINQRFYGAVRNEVNLSTLLKILESTGWVHFSIDGKKVHVYH